MVTLITVTKHLLKPEILCVTVSTTLQETIAKNANLFSTISHGEGPQHMMLVSVKNVSATVWPTNASMMNSLGTGAVLIAEKIQQDQNARNVLKTTFATPKQMIVCLAGVI